MSAESRAVLEQALIPQSDSAPDPAAPPSPTPATTPSTPESPAPRGAGSVPATPGETPPQTPKPAAAAANKPGAQVTQDGPIERRQNVVLQNARDKERASWEEKFGISFADAARVEEVRSLIASGIRPVDAEALQHFQAFNQDPAGYMSRFAHLYGYRPVVAGDPAQAAPAASAAPAARTQPRAPFQKPEPRFRSDDGAAAYSNDQVDQIIGHLQEEFAATVSDLQSKLEDFGQFATEGRLAQRQAVAWNKAEERMRDFETRPGFTPEVQAEMARLIRADKSMDPEVAFARAQTTHYVPLLERQTRQRVIDELGSLPKAPVQPSPAAVATRTSQSQGKRGGMDSRSAIQHAMNVHGVERL